MQRESPWGPLEIADAHLHFFSRAFFSALIAQKPELTVESAAAKLGAHPPPAETEKLAAAWKQELDRNGVNRAALIASIPGDEASVTAAAAAYPDRFFAYAMVNPKSWKAEKFERVRAACLFPAMHGYSILDDCARPVWEWAEQNHRILLVHCGVLSVGVRGRLGLESRFDMRFSNPIDLHPIALRHPTVPVVVPHFGAGYFREALMLADLCPNVYFDTSSSNSWMRYQESQMDLRQVFRKTLDVVGPRRLLFGTDSSMLPPGWRRQIFEEQATALYEIGLSAPDARAIFGENLLRIILR
ncbi:MAG: amidohydrolase family protein [Bryobacteraceae bacterium]